MSSRPASPPPISRWPFYAGVAVLFVLAGSILLYADRPFTAPVMIVTLVCACLGIALGILPEMLDSEKRTRLAEAAIRDAADAQLRRLAQTADQLTHVVSRGQSTEEQAGQALGTLEEVAERMVAQAEELAAALTRSGEREQAAHAEELQRLVDERDQKLTGLEIRLNATSVALSETQAALKKSSTSTGRAIETLASRLEEIAVELREAIAARVVVPTPVPASELPPPQPLDGAAAEAPTRAFEAEHATIDIAPPAPAPASEAASPAAPEANPVAAADVPAVDSVAEHDAPAPAGETAVENEPAPAPRPPRKPRNHRAAEKSVDKPATEEAAAATTEPAAAEEPLPSRPTAPLELALEGMPEPRPLMRLNRREPPGSTSLVATAYIGIGNKLYLRGDGPGLSWERGVPMQFLAIGKWGWTTTEAAVPVTCRVYRNDDTPMLEENIVIDPGSKSEITPKF
jgi:hypothetical protein